MKNPRPHVTFLAHMTLKEDDSHSAGELVRRIQNIGENTLPFSLPYGGKERFGVDNEHVVLICEDSNQEAANLHNTLLKAVSSLVDFG